jgi:SH3-like domain-containing protein
MRTDPSKPGSGGTSLDPGSKVQLLGDSRTVGNEQWVHIRSADGSEGWVPATSVQITR